jgi:photosystem II stability/assembly factor-like uncharacterized protein
MSKQFSPKRLFGLAVAVVGLHSLAGAQVDASLYNGLVWRNIGPFRGGRVAAVSGAIGQPGVYYMGMPLGGVWKTTSAGETWFPIFDDVKDASSVGAVEVAPSDPNVIYVGMGDMITGGGINEGNGVYKSTDAGKTWIHLGLDKTKQIPSILVDPHDPDIVMVAAQGNVHEKSADRGLYRSTDGGKTWKKTLYVNDTTGIQKIAWAYDNPKVMLATTVRHYFAPGAGRGFGGGGGGQQGDTGTHLFKSTDEGLTWKELDNDTVPDLSGRTCVAIANGTNSQRMFLVSNSGLYRSDDAGENWRQMDAKDPRVRNGQGGYNCGVYVNPKNPDIVYVINTSSYISYDGGKSFTGFKGAPGGDDPQQMWLDPTDGNRLFLGTDQGATISLDGGHNWSSWYNQPTAQVYHISTDTQYPYWVYATQQDSGSIATASRGNLGEITPLDWLPHPGYEFGSICADPLNPKVSYAGGPAGGIIKVTYPSGQWINVSPNVDSGEALRKVGNQPIGFSPSNPHELLVGFQYLMSTTDGGLHWHKLSPDLGYPKDYKPPKPGATPAPGATPPRPGSVDNDADVDQDSDNVADPDQPDDSGAQGPGGGGAIESFSASTVADGTIWVGTNNGLIKVTKDHGRVWQDVSIPSLPNSARADISAIDASHQDPGTAYVAVDYHNSGDFTPWFYRTHDYGKSWTKIVDGLPTGLPSGSFARVIRADTKKEGLLFAGTESFMYVSFNDGDTWQPLALNAPNTSYRDATIHGDDLVVGTYGRGFWILDDIAPLREVTPNMVNEPVHFFKPSDAIRVRKNVNGDTPFPPEVPHALNPPLGAILYYYLGKTPADTITLDVYDSTGKPVRHMSSAPIAPLTELPPNPDYWTGVEQPLPDAVGLNRINWNLRYDSPNAFNHSWEINANPHDTPASPEGPLVGPGVYTLKLTVDGKTYTQTVKVNNDPRSPTNGTDVRAESQLEADLYHCAQQAWDEYQAVVKVRAEVADALKQNKADDLAKAGNALDAKLTAVGGSGGFGRGFGGGGGGFRRGPAGPRVPNFAASNRTLVGQMTTLDSGDMAPSEPMQRACAASCAELKKAEAAWALINQVDIPEFNKVLAKYGIKPLAPAR